MSTISKQKKPANLTIEAALLAEAKELGINISQSAEDGLKKAVSRAKSDAWKKENAEALESWNEWVEKNGIPLEEYRQF